MATDLTPQEELELRERQLQARRKAKGLGENVAALEARITQLKRDIEEGA